MRPRPLDPEHDLARLAALLGHTRANGGIWHPGGIQWGLRELSNPDFEAHVWPLDDELVAFVMSDETFVIAEANDRGPARLELLEWAEQRLRRLGQTSIETSVVNDDPLHEQLGERGFVEFDAVNELIADIDSEIDAEATPAPLPPGFVFGSLLDVSDDAYIELHRAAWSDRRPSPYRREVHDAVKQMPQFRADLVTIAIAPDGTPAAYCIGWLDERSATLEIEPLGTNRSFRRLGLALAVVHEVTRRAWLNGARWVLVWNHRSTNEAAYGLYTSAGMKPRRHIVDMRKSL